MTPKTSPSSGRVAPGRVIRAATGTQLSAKSWLTEAPLRMLMNNLDPAVAERPEELVVYGGIGRAARDWDSFDRIDHLSCRYSYATIGGVTRTCMPPRVGWAKRYACSWKSGTISARRAMTCSSSR